MTDKLLETLREGIVKLFEPLGEFFGKLFSGIFGNAASSCLDIGTAAYNKIIKYAVDLLKESPDTWNGGSGWNVMQTVNTSFIAVGASLVIIFWCIKLCSDNLDIRQTMRPETMIKELTILVVAEWFVVSAFDLFASLFGLVDYLAANILPASNSANISIPSDVAVYINSVIEGTNVGSAFLAMCFSALYLLVLSCCGIMILYFSYVRFFKVLIIAPYGSIVTSTVAGPHSISHSSVAFFKYALSSILEAVTMILVIKLGSALISSGTVSIFGNATVGDLGTFFEWCLQSIILTMVMVGGIKESSIITQKVLGA